MSKIYKIKNNFHECTGASPDPAGETFFCSLCGFILSTESDIQSHSENDCCHECYLTFVESRRDSWKKGWRPKKREINKYINNRKKLIINTEKRRRYEY